MLYLVTPLATALVLPGGMLAAQQQRAVSVRMQTDAAFGASHTSFYTDSVKQDKYFTLEEILEEKMADKPLASVIKTMVTRHSNTG